jgi:Fur family peroxide stress response transcriptional regulator
MTKNRLTIKEILLAEKRHLSALDIWGIAKEHGEEISLATVYNSLKHLVATQQVIELRVQEGCALYDARLDHHAHILCTSCGEIKDVELAPHIAKIQRETEKVSDYEFHSTEVTLKGTCLQCRQAGKSESNRI